MGQCCSQSYSASDEYGFHAEMTKECPVLEWTGQVFLAYCAQVVDGDTVKLNVKTPFGTHRYTVRLAGVDSPEMKSPIPDQQRHAKACKVYVEQSLLHQFCLLKCGKFDKYGRLLGNVYLKHELPQPSALPFHPADTLTFDSMEGKYWHLNDQLLRDTPAVAYSGRTKSHIVIDHSLQSYHPRYIQIVLDHNPDVLRLSPRYVRKPR